MVHPATQRVAKAAIAALDTPLDIGFVFPPKSGEDRGHGLWTNRDLGRDDILAMLPRAAAANADGGNVFMRLGPSSRDAHPGIVMLDDLTVDGVEQLSRDGFEPCLITETSPGNCQAWIRLIDEGTLNYGVVAQAVRHLAQVYGGDERAVSPRQPGRLPGFTNRKPKHQLVDGKFPFVKLTAASPGRVASKGADLVHWIVGRDTARAAAGAAPQTPRFAAIMVTNTVQDISDTLDSIYHGQKARILHEVAEGRRPVAAASESEIDFAVTRVALAAGIHKSDIVDWIGRHRAEKDEAYAERTLHAAAAWGARIKSAP